MEVLNSPRALGDVIRRRRRALGLSQDDLALTIGVDRRVIGQLERGKETVRADIAFRAAQAVGLDLVAVVRGASGA